MTWQIFDKWRLRQNDGNAMDLNLPGGNGFKVALISSALAPLQNTHDFWNDLVANEMASGGNYTTGGNLCATPTISNPDGAGLITFDAADPSTWSKHASGFTTARFAILYLDTGVTTTSGLIAYEDFVSDKGNVAGDFSILFATAGIITLPR